MTTNPTPVRGEVWRIRFDPAEGDEIKKVRTAVVINENAIGRLRLKIVVPTTEWKLTPGQLDDIANAIAICVGAP
jgi:mRNA-degrading endonuclease toxin of MazEF toxin-antitoxin module